MKFLSLLPLFAAALAISLMLVSPLPAAAGRIYGYHNYQRQGDDHRQSRTDSKAEAGRESGQKWRENSFESRPQQAQGSRRDPVTGIWRPYR